MSNAELILALGLGLLLLSLTVLLPPVPSRPTWLSTVLAVGAAVCGLLAFVVVLLR